jgi:hypothetical protein
MLVALLLPQTTGPYLILILIGFAVGGYGSYGKLPVLVIAGILLILAGALGFQAALNVLPKPPGFP